jgi:hypothetical protein
MRSALLLGLALTMAITAGCGSDNEPQREIIEGYGAKLDEAKLRATIEGKKLTVSLALERVGQGSGTLEGQVTVKLIKLGQDDALGEGTANFSLGSATEQVEVLLDAPQINSVGELGGYALHYRVQLPGGALLGRRSLFMAVERAGVAVIGNDRFVVGEQGVLRVVSLAEGGERLAGTPVRVTLEQSGQTRTLVDKATDSTGEVEVRFVPTEAERGAGTIRVEAGTHRSSHAVTIEGERNQVLLTTDKPLYQPGQVVHVRALVMRQPQVVPLANTKLLLEVEDPAGNKLVKQDTTTDAHGIAALRFELARLVGLGTYKAQITVAGVQRVKTFEVARYTLPKFKVSLGTNARYYAPKAMISGWVQADYFFGKRVQQGAIKLTVRRPPSAQPLHEIVGKTNAQGRFDFNFSATSEGKLVLTAEVQDASGAVATAATSTVVSKTDALLKLIPERKRLDPGLPNRYFVLLTDPAGGPRGGAVNVRAGTFSQPVTIPATGIAEVTLPAGSCGQVVYAELQGALAKHFPKCKNTSLAGLRIDADQALYALGGKATITVTAPKNTPLAQLEVLRGNATVSAMPIPLVDGRGSLELPLGGALAGTLTLKLYALDGERALSDSKPIRVARANQLKVSVSTDKTSYRPAETAKVTLQLTDAAGQPTPGALGVQVVDEALYALTEVKPGIERSAFYLDQELLSAGADLPLISPQVLLSATPTAEQQLQARVLFAAAGDQTTYPIDTNSLETSLPLARSSSRRGLSARMSKLRSALEKWFDRDEPQNEAAVKSWVKGYLGGMDDFGQPYRIEAQVDDGYGYGAHVSVQVRSAGMDETMETLDDIYISVRVGSYYADSGTWGGADSSAADMGSYPGSDAGPSPDGGGSAPTVRQDFPETLYVDPSLITDSQGKATIDLALADSVTSWRLTSIAHTSAGQLGSSVAAITVFQPFFVDTVLPTHLLQNDEVEVPVAIYNYLQKAQTVTVELKTESWFTLLDAPSKQVTVAAKSVGSVTFKLRADKVGNFAFTATGRAAAESDAVKRSIRVLPDGKRQEIVRSGLLQPGTTTETLTIPQSAIDGASELYVKVYPGLLSEVVEGLESMLRKPHGCFEQTSSSTYPNIMVLQYLNTAGQATPTLKTKAEGFIADGYQRLLKYEVKPSGGFSLWGKPPANLVLSAFGLMEFSDMAKVRYVDPQILARTQTYIVSQQAGDGAFAPPANYNYYEIPGNAAKGTLRTTAYVAWALAQSGYKGQALTSALSYLRSKIGSETDPYTIALAANALLTVSAQDTDGLALVQKLQATAKPEGPDAVSWDSSGCSLTYGYGKSMKIEATALAVGAMLLAKDSGPTTSKGLRFLAQSKGSLGGYSTTQATVLALRALILALEARGGDKADGTLNVMHGGLSQGTAVVTPQTSDVTRLFDLKQVLVEGTNTVDITFNGKGELAYQVVAVYYEPHTTAPGQGPLSLTVNYDKTAITLAESIGVTAEVKNSSSGAVPTVMLRLGLPAGFTVELDDLTKQPAVNFAERDGAYLVLYLGTAPSAGTQKVTFSMSPTIATKSKAPASSVYPYYTPEYLQLTQTPTVTVTP